MQIKEMLAHVDHTQLKPFCTWEDIKKLCEEALECNTASVCIPPSYVGRVRDAFGDKLTICTVIGFPLGYSTTAVKVQELKDALANGCDEFDMVINIGDVKNKEFDKVETEIRQLKKAAGTHILKVIVETCYLTQEEKEILCRCVTKAGADYIKTSTGFGTSGAVLEDILLFSKNIGSNVKIKAAGGIKTKEDLCLYLDAGCDRIGTSATASLKDKN